MVKKRLLKTIVYRVTTVVMQQLISWIVFHRIAINLIILGCEVVRCSYYYVYDWVWEIFNINQKGGENKNGQKSRRGVSLH